MKEGVHVLDYAYIGMKKEELTTPALLIDLDALERKKKSTF